ncbi:MAG: hypothetical protein JWN02_2769, partial [Acidobacteria bacterium]|nr:hypothetical protein [Acidobacteriota bacterium]
MTTLTTEAATETTEQEQRFLQRLRAAIEVL